MHEAINLAKYTFFEDLKKDHLELLSRHVIKDYFNDNEYIFREQQKASKLFLILSGKVAIESTSTQGKQVSIQTLKEDDILGWSWMVPPYEWRFSARTLEHTELLIMDGEFIRDKSAKDHDLGYEIYKRLAGVFAQRLEATRHLLRS